MNSPTNQSPSNDPSSDNLEKEIQQTANSDSPSANDVLEIIAVENRHLGYELHDGLLQQIIGAGMLLEALRHRIKEGHQATEQDILTISGLLQDAITEGRQLIGRLESNINEPSIPLAQSLDDLVKRVQMRSSRIHLHLNMIADASRLNPKTQSHLLGIVRESVANALHHSRGKNIWISFDRVTSPCVKDERDNRNSYLLEVRDDGIGLTTKQDQLYSPKNHFGLSSLRFRAAAIGGQLEIQSAPGQGTKIRVSLPATDPA
jgi:two-component system nitrate/nitrite sensor histidine kinase NarQ